MDIIELNSFGLAVWRNKDNPYLFAQRSYYWCDQITVLNEKEGRRVVHSGKFSDFNFTDWIPMTKEEYRKVVQKFLDAY